MPMVRRLVSIPAGLARMHIELFVALTAVGSGLWNGLLIMAGWLLGDRWEVVGEYVRLFSSG